MLNIYVIVLTIIVLYVLNIFWKYLDFEKKVIEGFAETQTSDSDRTAIENLASAYNSGTATLTNLTTTGNLNVSGTSTLNDVTIASEKTLNIPSAESLKIGSVTDNQNLQTLISASQTGNFSTDINFTGSANLIKGTKPANNSSTDLGLYSYTPGNWIRYVATKDDSGAGGRHVFFNRTNNANNANGETELVSIEANGQLNAKKGLDVTGNIKTNGEVLLGSGDNANKLMSDTKFVRVLPQSATSIQSWGPGLAAKFVYGSHGFEAGQGGIYKGKSISDIGDTFTDLGIYGNKNGEFVRYVTNNGSHVWYTDGNYGSDAKMALEPNGNLKLQKSGQSFCIGNTCIGEDHLKILKGEKYIKLGSRHAPEGRKLFATLYQTSPTIGADNDWHTSWQIQMGP
jgi:hypothetical protein